MKIYLYITIKTDWKFSFHVPENASSNDENKLCVKSVQQAQRKKIFAITWKQKKNSAVLKRQSTKLNQIKKCFVNFVEFNCEMIFL